MDSADWKNGQRLAIHVNPIHDLPAFNAVCEVVSRKVVESASRGPEIKYGVRFVEIKESALDLLSKYARKYQVAKAG